MITCTISWSLQKLFAFLRNKSSQNWGHGCDRCVHSLHIAFFHENFPCFGTQGLRQRLLRWRTHRACMFVCVKLTIITSRTFGSPPITTQNLWGWSNCPQFCVVCDFRLASRIPVQSDPRQIRLDFCFFDVLTPPHESQSEELFGLQFSQCPASVAVLSACLNLTLPLPLPQRPLCLMSADLSHKLTMGSMIKN